MIKNAKNGVTVAGVFRQTLAKHPQKAAFIFEDKTWTFQDVEDYSNQIANYFKSQGYKKGEVVALFLESRPEFVCLWLGLSKLGVITALVNTNLRLKSLKHCITVAESKAVIYGSNLAGKFKKFLAECRQLRLAWLFECQATVGSKPWQDQHSGSLNNCLCNYICKRLDSLVFLDKDDKLTINPVSQLFSVHSSAGCKRTHTVFRKSSSLSSWCCG